MIGLIVNGVSQIAQNYFDKKKADINLKKTEVEAKTQIAKQVAEGKLEADKLNAEWENKAVESLGNSWKDEFITIVVLTPCILIFFPSLQPFVRLGFDILGTLPEWYINLIYITVCAGLGLKGVGGLSKFMRKK